MFGSCDGGARLSSGSEDGQNVKLFFSSFFCEIVFCLENLLSQVFVQKIQ